MKKFLLIFVVIFALRLVANADNHDCRSVMYGEFIRGTVCIYVNSEGHMIASNNSDRDVTIYVSFGTRKGSYSIPSGKDNYDCGKVATGDNVNCSITRVECQ